VLQNCTKWSINIVDH